jgi:hypothetical protein
VVNYLIQNYKVGKWQKCKPRSFYLSAKPLTFWVDKCSTQFFERKKCFSERKILKYCPAERVEM